MLRSTIASSETWSRCFTSARRLLPWAAIKTRSPRLDGRCNRFFPIRQESRHGIFKALGERKLFRGQAA